MQVVVTDRRFSDRDPYTDPVRAAGGERPTNRPLYDGTFGVVGLGRIGRSAARKVRGYGMDVIAHDPYQHEDIFAELDVERVDFDQLLERSDCVSVHAPLTGETHHMLSASEFARMKDDAVVVNTARGPKYSIPRPTATPTSTARNAITGTARSRPTSRRRARRRPRRPRRCGSRCRRRPGGAPSRGRTPTRATGRRSSAARRGAP